MSPSRVRAAIVGVAASAIVCSGALSGCSISRDDEPDPPSNGSSEPATATSEPSAQPSTSASPSTEPSPSPTASTPATTPGTTLAAALLAAAELPQLNDTSAWTERRTGPAGARPFGRCQRFSLLDIGAVDVVERTFTTGPNTTRDTAGQQVAEFPDSQNAVRASKVIEAWHRACARRVKGRNVKVRPITDVAVPTGRAWWYLVSYERRGTGHFHSLGLVLSNTQPTNTRMTLIRMAHDGQDHNYEPGMDPMELAIKAASARLG